MLAAARALLVTFLGRARKVTRLAGRDPPVLPFTYQPRLPHSAKGTGSCGASPYASSKYPTHSTVNVATPNASSTFPFSRYGRSRVSLRQKRA
jgi:hypothetical protein